MRSSTCGPVPRCVEMHGRHGAYTRLQVDGLDLRFSTATSRALEEYLGAIELTNVALFCVVGDKLFEDLAVRCARWPRSKKVGTTIPDSLPSWVQESLGEL